MSTCIGGCGFYGTPERKGYCSSCEKKYLLNNSQNNPQDTNFQKWNAEHEKQKKQEEMLKKRTVEHLIEKNKKNRRDEPQSVKFNTLEVDILLDIGVFSVIAKFLEISDVYQIMQSAKSLSNLVNNDYIWNNLFENKYGKEEKPLIGTCYENLKMRASYQIEELTWDDFIENTWKLEKAFKIKIRKIGKLGNIASPFDELIPQSIDRHDISKIIEFYWKPLENHLPDFIEQLKQNTKHFVVVRDELSRWHLIYIFKLHTVDEDKDEEDGSLLGFLSGGLPYKKELEFEWWGKCPPSLTELLSIHNGFGNNARLDYSRDAVYDVDSFVNYPIVKDKEILTFFSGTELDQCFVRDSGSLEQEPNTGQYWRRYNGCPSPEISFYNYLNSTLTGYFDED